MDRWMTEGFGFLVASGFRPKQWSPSGTSPATSAQSASDRRDCPTRGRRGIPRDAGSWLLSSASWPKRLALKDRMLEQRDAGDARHQS